MKIKNERREVAALECRDIVSMDTENWFHFPEHKVNDGLTFNFLSTLLSDSLEDVTPSYCLERSPVFLICFT
jgi:hypothetical protein